MAKRWIIGLDADDTLWHNERHFQSAQGEFTDLLRDYVAADHLHDRLIAAERRNLGHYGFGAKGFTLSMIETALDVTDGQVPGKVIARLLAIGRDMLAYPIELLPGVAQAIDALADKADLRLVTKGDLLDQERKLAQSGLGDRFANVDIVSNKSAATYARIFAGCDPDRAMMVGNSLKSDVIPALSAGLWGVHVPHDLTWALEHADAPTDHARFRSVTALADLPELIAALV